MCRAGLLRKQSNVCVESLEMKNLFVGVLALVLSLSTVPALAVDWTQNDPEDVLIMELRTGPVYIWMRESKAPNHVARIRELTEAGFYNGLKFHRVIDGFMAQTGDPLGDGTGGSGQNIKAEFNRLPHLRGTVSMARSGDPDSADSQFFIMFTANRSLDRNYTVWGRVIEGMEHVDQITKGDPGMDGVVEFPDIILRMRVAKDVPESEGGPPADLLNQTDSQEIGS